MQNKKQNAYFIGINGIKKYRPSIVAGQGLDGKREMEMSLRRAFSEWRRYRQTVNELSRMSDHELRDIGVLRGEIGLVARRVAN